MITISNIFKITLRSNKLYFASTSELLLSKDAQLLSGIKKALTTGICAADN